MIEAQVPHDEREHPYSRSSGCRFHGHPLRLVGSEIRLPDRPLKPVRPLFLMSCRKSDIRSCAGRPLGRPAA